MLRDIEYSVLGFSKGSELYCYENDFLSSYKES